MSRLRPGRIILIALAVCALSATADAQSSSSTQKKPPVQSPAGSRNPPRSQPPALQNPAAVPVPHRDLATRLRASAAIVREDPHRALQMLQGLDREYPRNSEVLSYIGDAYQAMGEVDSAAASYGRALSANAADARAGASLGTLYIQRGERERGEEIFRGIIARNQPSLAAYRTIGATLAAAGFNDLALRWYDEGRGANNGHYIFTLDIAQLHRQMAEYDKALDEYLRLIGAAPQQAPLAQDRILELLRDPRSDDETLLSRLSAASSAAIEASSPNSAAVARVLAMAYLESGMIENALEAALESEKTGASDGKVLFSLAEKTAIEYRRQPPASRPKYFDMALRAYEAFIDGHPKAPEVPRAKLAIADLLMDLASGRVEKRPGAEYIAAAAKATEALDWMIAKFPGSDHAEEAYLRKGDIVFRIEKNPQAALAIYQEGLTRARIRPAAFAERLGRVFLVLGDYQNAEGYFTRLVNDRDRELHDTGVYYAGLLLGIRGKYEAARDTLTSLAEGNPASLMTNDAIGLAWAIEEGLQGDQKNLASYIAALRCEVAEDTTGAIEALRPIVSQPADTPLRSRSLLRTGGLLSESGRFDEAVAAFETFVRDYPTDVRVADAHHAIARVYEYGYGDRDRALEKYEDILLAYPHYIYLDDVRDDVTRIRNQIQMGAQGGSS
jgi:tetratricopeptide (TPR) repeat protein